MKQSVTIKIGGHRLSLRTEDDPSYVQALAEHLSEHMEEIRRGAETASAHQIALLAGLRVVDELFRLRQSLNAMESAVSNRVHRVLTLLDEHDRT